MIYQSNNRVFIVFNLIIPEKEYSFLWNNPFIGI